MISKGERKKNIKQFNWYRDNVAIPFFLVPYKKHFPRWLASHGGSIPGYMRAVMFSDDDMSKVASTNSNNDIWDNNNVLRCKHNPNRSLKE